MEQIQRALQLYRQSQGKRGRRPPLDDPSIPNPIVYTETAVVAPCPLSLVENRVLTVMHNGPYLESFKILRTKVLHRLQEHDWNVLGVTSPGRQEGKTLVAVNLAISIAMDRKHTALLVDANLRTPHVHEIFGIDNTGLAEFLFDDIPLSDLLVHPQIERLVVLPAGRALTHTAEALNLQKMAALIEEMRHRYPSRVIIVDLPPLLETADVIGLAPKLDAILLVAEADHTNEKKIERAIAMVQGTAPLLGTVLNKTGSYS